MHCIDIVNSIKSMDSSENLIIRFDDIPDYEFIVKKQRKQK